IHVCECQRVGCFLICHRDSSILIIQTVRRGPCMDGLLVRHIDIEGMKLSTDGHGSHRMDLENMCVVIGMKTGVLEQTTKETADCDFFADALVEQRQPGRRILQFTANVGLKLCHTEAEV